MRKVRVLSEAADEAAAAAAFYEVERPGLGAQFQDALYQALLLLSEEVVPLTNISPTLTARNVRRLIMRRFPYSIILREVGVDVVEVIALAHHSRRPYYWRDRLRT